MSYTSTITGGSQAFESIPEVLAKANEEKTGDQLAGIAADSEAERVAAKDALSRLSLEILRESPAVPYEDDEVTRVIQDAVDEAVYDRIKDWTVADLREFLLDDRTREDDIDQIRPGLTSEMIAAAAKVMSNLDLIQATSKMRVTARCNNTIGMDGTLSFRLQPNDPADDVENIRHSIREGLSYGVGDAVIGLNPVEDTAEQTKRLLEVTKEFIEAWEVPTQNCVLSHLTTQLTAVENGAPADLLFQSLAGTEAGNESFGIDVDLLEEAYEFGQDHCTASGPNVMYFETGQGSELSADAHAGIDQVTLEARCYGLAKQYDPFIVNTVVGFIGPEYLYDGKQVIRAGLEDVFMGQLTGLSMGIDACYTNHIQADQNDIENLAVLLTAAGSNYFITVPMGDDTMLNYQSNSYHDAAALWDVFDLRPAPEFETWLEEMGIMEDGRLTANAGDPTRFLEHTDE
ncbi:ethanolamine ammonia-lyase subunit EutB [Halalkalicoccus jeotgali]|uniref:Putative ethanolamine ammonia-lyase large subunit n=1 Tax=Halalkalicoccus jeotgali (strain DSM 18796 / CECT 7217 / JCM 14584 / KCTC 4019 / B3) TaxID=795797 RepID=D8JBD8_HALJB|nr:ethanolamine ammonia-lyase subunit EutB [Halalkalicoccus jeotgali]ADJ16591.1 ethanolamine ammonia lyase large subunit [Halalkalicoccus jeotgali B3]ELY41312.1 ethanolamine ammonia lyase large subunit [Halalkalicoccus jeotgali B3]